MNRIKKEWHSQATEKFRERLGFETVIEAPSLPRVLLLGDSISIGYTLGSAGNCQERQIFSVSPTMPDRRGRHLGS